jgi:hypothetical protein
MPKKRKASINPLGESLNKSINTANEEKKMIKMLEREKAECKGVRIIGLSKTYHNNQAFFWD